VRLSRNANVSISATVHKEWVSIDLETIIVENKFITLILLVKCEEAEKAEKVTLK
jgi:hypothetical protein